MYSEAGRLETVLNKPRRHVVTFHDISPPGQTYPRALPADIAEQGVARFSIDIGPRPETGQVLVRAGMANSPNLAQVRLAVLVNSTECRAIEDHPSPTQAGDSARVTQFDVPLVALRKGYNQIEVRLKKGGKQRIVWMEIHIAP